MRSSTSPKGCGRLLNSAVLSAVDTQLSRKNYARVLKDCRELCVLKLSIASTLQAMRGNEYRWFDQTPPSRSPSKRQVRDIWLLSLNFLDSDFEVIDSKLYSTGGYITVL
jgi:hypothetical protein